MKKKLLENCLSIAYGYNPKHIEPYQHYSFVIQRNKIIEYGLNKRVSPCSKLGYPKYSKVHSEVDAYFNAKTFLENKFPFEVVNIRLSRKGKVMNSKPCHCCFSFLKALDCKRVWYTNGNNAFETCTFS